MERYQRAEMGRSEYLEKMGSFTLKATHTMGKTCLVVYEDDGELPAAPQQDQTLDDEKLSHTPKLMATVGCIQCKVHLVLMTFNF